MLLAMVFAGILLRAQQAPLPAQARLQSGLDLLNQRRYAEAEEAFRDAYRLDPSDLRGLMGQVEVKVAENQFDGAFQLLQDEVDKNPGRSELRLELGKLASRAGRLDQAASQFQTLVKETNRNYAAANNLYFLLGDLYDRLGNYDSAATNLRRALELRPRDAGLANRLAMVLQKGGKKEDAIRQYREVLKLDPDNGLATNNLADLLSESDSDLNEALILARRARELLPGVPETEDTLGWIYCRLKRFGEAVPLLDAVVHKAPGDPAFRFHLGTALQGTSDKAGALVQFMKALECNPPQDLERKIRAAIE